MSNNADSESRLQYHAQKFSSCINPGKVLQRYLAKLHDADADEEDVMRHACHVCARVSLASPPCAAGESRITEHARVSPVTVLRTMLGSLKSHRLDQRAHVALEAVSSTCALVLQSGQHHDSCRQDWIDLQRCVRKRMRPSNKQLSSEYVGKQHRHAISLCDVHLLKRISRMNRMALRWRQCSLTLRSIRLIEMETTLSKLDSSCASDAEFITLRRLLYEAIAALSKPRPKSVLAGNDTMGPHDEENLRTSAALQSRVRRIILQCLTLWKIKFQLEDSQIEHIFTHLRTFLSEFESLHNIGVEYARSGKQWLKLKQLLGRDQPPARHPSFTPEKARIQSQDVIHGNTFTPGDEVRALSAVHQAKHGITLRCNTCNFEIVSSWYVPSRDGSRRFLRPQNGHRLCKRSQFLSSEGFLTRRDSLFALPCDHGLALSKCATCSGKLSPRSNIVRGIYTPQKKIRALATVVQLEPPVTLTCSSCSFEIRCTWHVQPPGGNQRLLIPRKGHAQCGGAKFVPSPGVATQQDHLLWIPCQHGVSLMRCTKCYSWRRNAQLQQ